MSTLFLSLISTARSHVKLVTETKEDASALINKLDLFDNVGDFESLDFQFEINRHEVNNFDSFSGAKYKAFDSKEEMSYLNGTLPYMISFMDRDEAEIAMEMAKAKPNRKEDSDNILLEQDDYDYEVTTDFTNDFTSAALYNSDNAW